jgi:hypothetical protein
VLWQGSDNGTFSLEYALARVEIGGTLDYAVARGFAGGTTHRVEGRLALHPGTHVEISGGYRGSWERPLDREGYRRPVHVFTMEAKVML